MEAKLEMKINYTSRNVSITDQEKDKAARKFEKIHRILSANRNLEANVIFSKTRNVIEAEVTLRALHHTLVVSGYNANAFTALLQAIAKLEQQAVKNKHKLVDTRRPGRRSGELPPAVEAVLPLDARPGAAPIDEEEAARIVRGNGLLAKPLTVDEARLELETRDRDQVTFRDAESGNVCVLLRRRDGRFELVEAKA